MVRASSLTVNWEMVEVLLNKFDTHSVEFSIAPLLFGHLWSPKTATWVVTKHTPAYPAYFACPVSDCVLHHRVKRLKQVAFV